MKTITLVFLLFLAAACCSAAPTAVPPVRLNQAVPLDIALPEIRADHAAAMVDLSQRKGGSPLVLFFLSEQCGVTYYYKARLQKLVHDFEGRFVFVGVRCGKKLHPDAPVTLAETNYLKIPFADDDQGVLAARFAVRQSLIFAVIDKAGRLRYLGGFDDSVDPALVRRTPLRDALRAVAAGRPVSVQGSRSFGCAIVPIAP